MKKTKMGRPPKGDEAMMNPVTVRFPKAMSEAIDKLQAERMDAPDKGQVIRELVAFALQASMKRSAL